MLFGLSYMPGLFEVNWGELTPVIAKIVNLSLFVVAMYFVLRRPLAEAFRARQEGIRRDLLRAEEDGSAAVAKLQEVEARLARLDSEVEAIEEQAQREAAEERARIERAAEEEVRKIREQARREIESASKAARAELRTFTAEQSVRGVAHVHGRAEREAGRGDDSQGHPPRGRCAPGA